VAARKPTAEDMAALLEWISHGEEDACKRSIKAGCEMLGLHRGDVHQALMSDEWANKYTRAREDRGSEIAERVFDIAEKTMSKDEHEKIDPAAARVAMDAYRWGAARMAPKAWGDKSAVDVTSGGAALTIAVVGEHAKGV